jgi:hypothetical protein
MRFQVLTVASVKMTDLWDTAQCIFVEVDRRFKGGYCLRHQSELFPSTYMRVKDSISKKAVIVMFISPKNWNDHISPCLELDLVAFNDFHTYS